MMQVKYFDHSNIKQQPQNVKNSFKLLLQYSDSWIDIDPRLQSQVEYSMFQEGVLKPYHLKIPLVKNT